VFHFLHEFDLSLNRLSAIRVEQLVFFVNFHRHFFITRFMKADPDYGISTLSDLFSDNIVVKRAFIRENHAIIIRVLFFVVFLLIPLVLIRFFLNLRLLNFFRCLLVVLIRVG